jgi:hypothetical protein
MEGREDPQNCMMMTDKLFIIYYKINIKNVYLQSNQINYHCSSVDIRAQYAIRISSRPKKIKKK